jgi:hypothetical protein
MALDFATRMKASLMEKLMISEPNITTLTRRATGLLRTLTILVFAVHILNPFALAQADAAGRAIAGGGLHAVKDLKGRSSAGDSGTLDWRAATGFSAVTSFEMPACFWSIRAPRVFSRSCIAAK